MMIYCHFDFSSNIRAICARKNFVFRWPPKFITSFFSAGNKCWPQAGKLKVCLLKNGGKFVYSCDGISTSAKKVIFPLPCQLEFKSTGGDEKRVKCCVITEFKNSFFINFFPPFTTNYTCFRGQQLMIVCAEFLFAE